VFHGLARLFGLTEAQRRIRRNDFHVPVDQEQIRSGATLRLRWSCVFRN